MILSTLKEIYINNQSFFVEIFWGAKLYKILSDNPDYVSIILNNTEPLPDKIEDLKREFNLDNNQIKLGVEAYKYIERLIQENLSLGEKQNSVLANRAVELLEIAETPRFPQLTSNGLFFLQRRGKNSEDLDADDILLFCIKDRKRTVIYDPAKENTPLFNFFNPEEEPMPSAPVKLDSSWLFLSNGDGSVLVVPTSNNFYYFINPNNFNVIEVREGLQFIRFSAEDPQMFSCSIEKDGKQEILLGRVGTDNLVTTSLSDYKCIGGQDLLISIGQASRVIPYVVNKDLVVARIIVQEAGGQKTHFLEIKLSSKDKTCKLSKLDFPDGSSLKDVIGGVVYIITISSNSKTLKRLIPTNNRLFEDPEFSLTEKPNAAFERMTYTSGTFFILLENNKPVMDEEGKDIYNNTAVVIDPEGATKRLVLDEGMFIDPPGLRGDPVQIQVMDNGDVQVAYCFSSWNNPFGTNVFTIPKDDWLNKEVIKLPTSEALISSREDEPATNFIINTAKVNVTLNQNDQVVPSEAWMSIISKRFETISPDSKVLVRFYSRFGLTEPGNLSPQEQAFVESGGVVVSMLLPGCGNFGSAYFDLGSGDLSENHYLAAKAAIDYLREKYELNTNNITVTGVSAATATVFRLALEYPDLYGVILQSPVSRTAPEHDENTWVAETGGEKVPGYYPMQALQQAIKRFRDGKVKTPRVLVTAGIFDQNTPFGRTFSWFLSLLEAASDPTRLNLVVYRGSHSTGYPEVVRSVATFLNDFLSSS